MVAVVLLVVVLGLAYALWRTVLVARSGTGARALQPPRVRRRAPTVPPDDNPEFLDELSRRNRENGG